MRGGVDSISLSGQDPANIRPDRPVSSSDVTLVGIDWDVLALAAGRYPECFYENEIAEGIDSTFVRTQNSVDRLVELELLSEHTDEEEIFYCLSALGRQYVVDHDLDQ